MLDAILAVVAVYLAGAYLLGVYLFARLVIGRRVREFFIRVGRQPEAVQQVPA